MKTDINLQFIRKKLDEAGIAIMYTMNNDVVKLPNDIIHYLTMDDNGQLWFTVPKPKYWIKNYAPCFPVRLFFYRKGIDFYVEITGTAIVNVSEDKPVQENTIIPESILLRMMPSVVEYTETKNKISPSKLSGLYSSLSNWLLGKIHTANIIRQAFSR